MLPRLPIALTALLSLAAVTVAVPSNIDHLRAIKSRDASSQCGSHLSPEAASEKEKTFASLLAENGSSDRVTDVTGNFTVPVNFNVIYASTNISDGYVP